MTPEGWRCPSCGSVYAPWVAKCSTCPRRGGVFDVQPFDVQPMISFRPTPIDPECDHEWVAFGIGPAVCTKCGATLPEVINP
jgi:hypothetical protein